MLQLLLITSWWDGVNGMNGADARKRRDGEKAQILTAFFPTGKYMAADYLSPSRRGFSLPRVAAFAASYGACLLAVRFPFLFRSWLHAAPWSKTTPCRTAESHMDLGRRNNTMLH
jgi:hypothetical protein